MLIKTVGYLLKFFIKTFQFFLPIKQQILFIAYGGKQYSCNPKYITEYLIKHYPNKFNIVWAFSEPEKFAYLKEKGIKIIPRKSLSFFLNYFSSKIIVTNTGVPRFNNKSKQFHIETWHGSGAYKRSDIKKPTGRFSFLKKALAGVTDPVNVFLSGCSRFTEEIIRKSFLFKGEVIEKGCPRNDIFFTDYSNITKKVFKHYNIPEGAKILLYAPTFRDSNKETSDYSIDYQKLNEALVSRFGEEWKVLFRTHHANKDGVLPLPKNIVDASNYPDMQELICASDILITDYSGCMWDFSLSGKPCFIYATDIDNFKQERNFYTPMEQWPFPIAKNNEELVKNIEKIEYLSYNKKVKQHHQDLGNFDSGIATKNICKRIELEYFKKG